MGWRLALFFFDALSFISFISASRTSYLFPADLFYLRRTLYASTPRRRCKGSCVEGTKRAGRDGRNAQTRDSRKKNDWTGNKEEKEEKKSVESEGHVGEGESVKAVFFLRLRDKRAVLKFGMGTRWLQCFLLLTFLSLFFLYLSFFFLFVSVPAYLGEVERFCFSDGVEQTD